jgi:hypothetical protein
LRAAHGPRLRNSARDSAAMSKHRPLAFDREGDVEAPLAVARAGRRRRRSRRESKP